MGRQSKYPEEFRRKAAASALDSGRSTRDVGREPRRCDGHIDALIDRPRIEASALPPSPSSSAHRGQAHCDQGQGGRHER